MEEATVVVVDDSRELDVLTRGTCAGDSSISHDDRSPATPLLTAASSRDQLLLLLLRSVCVEWVDLDVF